MYQQLNWEWSPDDSGRRFIPTVANIEAVLRDLIEGLDADFRCEGTGGLEVYYTEPSQWDSCGYAGLRFVLSSQWVYGPEGKLGPEGQRVIY